MTDIPVAKVSRILYRFVRTGIAKKQNQKGKGDGRKAPIYRLYFLARMSPGLARDPRKGPQRTNDSPLGHGLDDALHSIVRIPK